jgi:hypothetical protein
MNRGQILSRLRSSGEYGIRLYHGIFVALSVLRQVRHQRPPFVFVLPAPFTSAEKGG